MHVTSVYVYVCVCSLDCEHTYEHVACVHVFQLMHMHVLTELRAQFLHVHAMLPASVSFSLGLLVEPTLSSYGYATLTFQYICIYVFVACML